MPSQPHGSGEKRKCRRVADRSLHSLHMNEASSTESVVKAVWLPPGFGGSHTFSQCQPIAGMLTVIVPQIMRATEVNVRTRSGVGQLYGEPDTWILGQSRSNRTSPAAIAARASRVMVNLS